MQNPRMVEDQVKLISMNIISMKTINLLMFLRPDQVRKNPRITITTTNGDVRDGPLDHMIARAEQILKEQGGDNGLLPFISKLDDEKEVDHPLMWDKANPSLHYFPELQTEIKKRIY